MNISTSIAWLVDHPGRGVAAVAFIAIAAFVVWVNSLHIEDDESACACGAPLPENHHDGICDQCHAW